MKAPPHPNWTCRSKQAPGHFRRKAYTRNPTRFQSLHFEISNNLAKLTLFDRGTYVFESVPEDTPLSYFDIDEAKLISATEELIALTEPCSETVVSSHFENTVYSDKSGGYYLKYIKMD